jgi:hypothetical protein
MRPTLAADALQRTLTQYLTTTFGLCAPARPDILITNYKMLDLLLQRADDLPLWEGADLAYVVLDEFHTYDGAQGTDVAMLLRRLAAVLGVGDAQRPLGPICPVATSATLGTGGESDDGGMAIPRSRTRTTGRHGWPSCCWGSGPRMSAGWVSCCATTR